MPGVMRNFLNFESSDEMKFLPILFFIFLAGCSTQRQKIDPRTYSIKNRIIGKWGGLGEDSPVLRIDKDSVFYFGILKSYPYQWVDRSLVIDCSIDFGRKSILGSISINNDTMYYLLDNKLWDKIYRFK
jgi:hypothetical protein